MASRRFFSYDPYDYYYTSPSPYHYSYPYYQYQHPAAPYRGVGGFFPSAAYAADAAPEAVTVDPRPRVESSSRPVSIPVRFVGSEPDPEPERRHATTARMPPAAATVARKRALPSAEAAAVRLQAAARGYMARRSVRAVREVEREAAGVAEKIAREAEALRADARARIGVGEALMKLLLRLDAVRGAREYRRSVTKRVLALQDAVDALEPKGAVATEPEAVAAEEEESVVTDEMAEDGAAATERETELPPVDVEQEHGGEVEVKAAAETAADMEVDGDKADGETAPEALEGSEKLQDGGDNDGGKTEGSDDAEGEWEMVAEEPEPTTAAASTDAPPQEPVTSEVTRTTGQAAGAASNGGLDTRKVMEMVAALCEQNAQQCAVIGALAERVDTLERAVRRVEDAERRRRRGKKLKKQGKVGSNNSRCYSSD